MPNPTSFEPFNDWLNGEVSATIDALQARGATPAQAAYILTVALASVITQESQKPQGENLDAVLDVPLGVIGQSTRLQAMRDWTQTQIVN